MHRIFISDLHLESQEDQRAQRFSELLLAESKRVDEIFILGDLVEMWIGDDDPSPLAQWLSESLKQTTCSVYIMHGNRDFLFGDTFANSAGVNLIPDPYVTTDNLYLCHGDALCVDDQEYQTMRALFRSQEWQTDILSKSLQERQMLGEGLRAQSRNANANKAANIMDINHQALKEALLTNNCTNIIHGHTHRPGHHYDTLGDLQIQRLVMGSWEQCGWLARQIDEHLQLECFSLARRYEI